MEQIHYTYYWNDRVDDKGRNTSMWDGYQPGDPLREVYAGTIEWKADDLEICEDLFRLFNIAHPERYRGPSMSVGSVVDIAGVFYAVDRVGFKQIEKPAFYGDENEQLQA